MKTIINDISSIAHKWANKLQDNARTSNGSLYYEGNTIYSYGSHFPIAKHVGDDKILFTLRDYSNTTARHKGVVSQASNHYKKVYCYFIEDSNEDNFKQWQNAIEIECGSLLTAKKPEKYLNEIDRLIKQAEDFAEFKGVEIPEYLKEAKKIGSKEEYLTYKTKRDELAKEKERFQQLELKKQHAKELNEWRAYKTNRIYVHAGFDYLRYDAENKRIETTQSVKIPELAGKKFYNQILKTISKGGCIDCNTKFLDFNVSEINKEFIKVGCHTVEIKEIKKLAKKLNW